MTAAGDDRDDRWWRRAVVYEVYLRSFADSDGDGIGDLRGVRSRLDYLRWLGVDALWLTPFYPSPQADQGYDVRDHRSVDPVYGTLSELDELVTRAHALGLRVLVDLVPNHVSADHPWFRAARAGSGPARERFHVLPGRGPTGARPPNGWRSMFGGPAWSRMPDGAWYLHLFDAGQPDLNWSSPDVIADFDETLRFWAARGVDGFRVDVAGGLVKDPAYAEVPRPGAAGTGEHPYWDRTGVHEVYRHWRAVLDAVRPGLVGVAEVWGTPERVAAYARPAELGQAFAFALVHAPWSATALRRIVQAQLAAAGTVGALPAWVLSSHDFPRPATRHGPARSLALHLLALALPGACYLYQGDELGLPEVDVPAGDRVDPTFHRSHGRLPGRDGARVPLPWTADPADSYGFSSARRREAGGRRPAPHRPWLPQPPGWGALAVTAQQADPASPARLVRAALRLRRRWAAATDEVVWLAAPRGVLAFARDDLVCLLNASSRAVPLDGWGTPLVTSLGERARPTQLPPGAAAWLRRTARAPAPRHPVRRRGPGPR